MTDRFADIERRLRRLGPWLAAVAAVMVVWFMWGDARPVYHDEDSYVLQAEIFARGRWTVPTPPLPEFFEQPHVLSVPAVASKYPPGHALLLSGGARAGWVALAPLLLTAIASALLFALTARVTNAWIALTAWLLWITAPIVLRYQPSYFSQVTTTACILGSFWSLLRWRETGRRAWMLVMALAIAFGGITRPVSMLAFAIPLGVVVIGECSRRRAWTDLGAGIAIGLAVVAILPLWAQNTTGSWKETPVSVYRRQYLPFDKLGFSVDTTPPSRSLTPVVNEMYEEFRALRERQTLAALPAIVGDRISHLAEQVFSGWKKLLVPFMLLGVLAAPAVLRTAAAGALLLFIAHVPYGHEASWTVYYLETVPVLAVLTACGVWAAGAWLAGARARERIFAAAEPRLAAAVSLFFCVLVVAQAPSTLSTWRSRRAATIQGARHFTQLIRSLPEEPAIVFVRYSADRPHWVNMVHNHTDIMGESVWVVHDLRAHNRALARLAPGRATYLFDEADMRLLPYPVHALSGNASGAGDPPMRRVPDARGLPETSRRPRT